MSAGNTVVTAVVIGWLLSVATYVAVQRLGLLERGKTADTPATWEQMQRTLNLQQANLTTMARRLDEQQAEIDELREENEAVREENARLRTTQQGLQAKFTGLLEGVERLIGQIEQAQMTPVWRPAVEGKEPLAPPKKRRERENMTAIARLIDECFSREEIDGLVFEMGLDGKVTGETTEARASSLVLAAARRGTLARLVEKCREQRPEAGF